MTSPVTPPEPTQPRDQLALAVWHACEAMRLAGSARRSLEGQQYSADHTRAHLASRTLDCLDHFEKAIQAADLPLDGAKAIANSLHNLSAPRPNGLGGARLGTGPLVTGPHA